ncbi:transglycosylase SLT domain-containing protein [Paraburkholderia dipogonis]|uniref:transglycosylase SLT domain-containing protein n=1 Tax=Paraburkholderia dipogonis TaxID=1211383 RepID=UPI0038BC666C
MPELTRNLWLTAPMMRGGDVAQVQDRLKHFGAVIASDGLFGKATRDAVFAYQRQNKTLQPDGVIGRQTWAALFGNADAVLPDRVASDILDSSAKNALSSFHRHYASSVEWRLDPTGIIINGEAGAVFGKEETATVDAIMTNFGTALATVLSKVHVPIELVIACICAESSGNPSAVRKEKGCSTVDPALTPSRISVGLMQTLLSTASSVLNRDVGVSELKNPLVSIEAGATYMWRQSRETHFDPPLAACAYNAGSLRFNGSPNNRWKLVQYPIGTSAHADRFIRFFNAAMNSQQVTQAVQSLGDRIPSMR